MRSTGTSVRHPPECTAVGSNPCAAHSFRTLGLAVQRIAEPSVSSQRMIVSVSAKVSGDLAIRKNPIQRIAYPNRAVVIFVQLLLKVLSNGRNLGDYALIFDK